MNISHYSFGRITIDGNTYSKDLKIIKGEILQGWWRDQGHLVQVQDILDVLEARPHTLIVGTGASGLMKIASEVPAKLGEAGIRLESMPTGLAVERFNELVSTMGEEQVAAAFHLTC